MHICSIIIWNIGFFVWNEDKSRDLSPRCFKSSDRSDVENSFPPVQPDRAKLGHSELLLVCQQLSDRNRMFLSRSELLMVSQQLSDRNRMFLRIFQSVFNTINFDTDIFRKVTSRAQSMPIASVLRSWPMQILKCSLYVMKELLKMTDSWKSAWRHSVYYYYDKARNTPYFASWHLGDSLGVYRWPQCRYKRMFYKSHSRLSKITTGNRCRNIRTMQNVTNRNLIDPYKSGTWG